MVILRGSFGLPVRSSAILRAWLEAELPCLLILLCCWRHKHFSRASGCSQQPT